MKNYELTYLLSPTISDEEQKKTSEEISALIQNNGGVLKEGGLPIKRILPKTINRHKEILSTSISFYIDPVKIQEIESKIKEIKTILRSIIVVKKIHTAPKPIRKRIKTEEDPQKKVDLKDIENKINEILKEE
jgi:ribosomal protein S6